jgi:hypothetical protein
MKKFRIWLIRKLVGRDISFIANADVTAVSQSVGTLVIYNSTIRGETAIGLVSK